MITPKCHPNKKHGGRGLCKPCYNKWLRGNNKDYGARSDANIKRIRVKEKVKYGDNLNQHRALKNRYNITLEEYNELLRKQNNSCAICRMQHNEGKFKKLHVDHCHVTGKVRGLLCPSCNSFMGKVDKDISVIIMLTQYIKKQELI